MIMSIENLGKEISSFDNEDQVIAYVSFSDGCKSFNNFMSACNIGCNAKAISTYKDIKKPSKTFHAGWSDIFNNFIANLKLTYGDEQCSVLRVGDSELVIKDTEFNIINLPMVGKLDKELTCNVKCSIYGRKIDIRNYVVKEDVLDNLIRRIFIRAIRDSYILEFTDKSMLPRMKEFLCEVFESICFICNRTGSVIKQSNKESYWDIIMFGLLSLEMRKSTISNYQGYVTFDEIVEAIINDKYISRSMDPGVFNYDAESLISMYSTVKEAKNVTYIGVACVDNKQAQDITEHNFYQILNNNGRTLQIVDDAGRPAILSKHRFAKKYLYRD